MCHLTASWEAGCVKTTMDLPNDLVREMKLKAAHEGRKIKDVVAPLILAGMAAESGKTRAVRPIKGALKLPLFRCTKDAPDRRLSIEGDSCTHAGSPNIAGFARGHGISLVTLDKDFTNFKGLSVNYLLSASTK